jgi:hypothetical protein
MRVLGRVTVPVSNSGERLLLYATVLKNNHVALMCIHSVWKIDVIQLLMWANQAPVAL